MYILFVVPKTRISSTTNSESLDHPATIIFHFKITKTIVWFFVWPRARF